MPRKSAIKQNRKQGEASIEAQSKKKVLVVSFYFHPTNKIAAVRSGKFAKYLPRFGWEPFVLTADEVKGCSQDLPVYMDESSIFRTPYCSLSPTISYGLKGGQRTVY